MIPRGHSPFVGPRAPGQVRALLATVAPFARSIDGRLAHHDFQTSGAWRVERGVITLSDREGQG